MNNIDEGKCFFVASIALRLHCLPRKCSKAALPFVCYTAPLKLINILWAAQIKNRMKYLPGKSIFQREKILTFYVNSSFSQNAILENKISYKAILLFCSHLIPRIVLQGPRKKWQQEKLWRGRSSTSRWGPTWRRMTGGCRPTAGLCLPSLPLTIAKGTVTATKWPPPTCLFRFPSTVGLWWRKSQEWRLAEIVQFDLIKTH